MSFALSLDTDYSANAPGVSFLTPPVSSTGYNRLALCVVSVYSGLGVTISSVSTLGLMWTLVASYGTGSSDCEVWTAPLVGPFSGHVAVTFSGSCSASVVVDTFYDSGGGSMFIPVISAINYSSGGAVTTVNAGDYVIAYDNTSGAFSSPTAGFTATGIAPGQYQLGEISNSGYPVPGTSVTTTFTQLVSVLGIAVASASISAGNTGGSMSPTTGLPAFLYSYNAGYISADGYWYPCTGSNATYTGATQYTNGTWFLFWNGALWCVGTLPNGAGSLEYYSPLYSGGPGATNFAYTGWTDANGISPVPIWLPPSRTPKSSSQVV